ncbi:MAG: FAD-dependent oxidoreductase [Desulfovermiculus sp.]|nr:FAD-dependent oxidoreductase [Desulfovermiculus sp.]
MPHVVAGLASGQSIVNQDKMFADNGIHMHIDRVEEVDAKHKQVRTAQGKVLAYDKLILSTGSEPIVPPLEGRDLQGVFTLRSLSDAEKIRDFMRESQPKKLVMVGSGFISLETSALLLESNPQEYTIEVVEFLEQPLPLMLDPEMGQMIQDYLGDKGISMRMGQKVEKIVGRDGKVTGVELSSGHRVDADMVFLNVGARPNVHLAEQAGLEMGPFGIQVDEYLQTSDPDILAGGDCITNVHYITRKPAPTQLRVPAVIQGRYVAKRLAGYDFPFPGVLGASAVKLFDKYIAATGMTESMARSEGYSPVSATVQSRSKHAMIPGVKPWQIKLVFDRDSQKLLGGQIISDSEGPVKEIDTVNALILGGKTVADVTTLMCAGNPDCSSEPSMEPMAIAGEQVLQKLRA